MDRARCFLWHVKDTIYIYIYIYIKHLPRKQPNMKYGEGLGFTAYKKLENHQEKIADEIKLGFVCN